MPRLASALAGFVPTLEFPEIKKRERCSEHFLSGSNVRTGDVDALVGTAAVGA
jgi:hypothetical protein